MVILDLSTDTPRDLLVMLPGLGEDGDLDVCKDWADMDTKELVSITPRADVFDYDPDYLTNPNNKDLATRIWYGFVELVDASKDSNLS